MLDPWEAGRERQRENVRAIFARHGAAPPAAVQRRPAQPSLTTAPGMFWRRMSPRVRVVFVAVVAATAIAGAFGYAAAHRDARHNEVASRAQDAQRYRDAVATIRAQQAPRHGALGPGTRTDALARAVELRARADVRLGVLSGPIQRVACGPGADLVGATGPGAARVLRCLAVTSPAGTPLLVGHEYLGVVARDGRSATWCRRIAPPGHPDTAYGLQQALATPTPAVCTHP